LIFITLYIFERLRSTLAELQRGCANYDKILPADILINFFDRRTIENTRYALIQMFEASIETMVNRGSGESLTFLYVTAQGADKGRQGQRRDEPERAGA